MRRESRDAGGVVTAPHFFRLCVMRILLPPLLLRRRRRRRRRWSLHLSSVSVSTPENAEALTSLPFLPTIPSRQSVRNLDAIAMAFAA